MTITPPELLDTSIAQLQRPVVFLDDQLDWARRSPLSQSRRCSRTHTMGKSPNCHRHDEQGERPMVDL